MTTYPQQTIWIARLEGQRVYFGEVPVLTELARDYYVPRSELTQGRERLSKSKRWILPTREEAVQHLASEIEFKIRVNESKIESLAATNEALRGALAPVLAESD